MILTAPLLMLEFLASSHPAKQPDALDQTALHCHTCMPILVALIMYFIGDILSTCLSLKCQYSDSNLYSLYARPNMKHIYKVFLILPTPKLPFTLPLPIPPKMFLHSPLYLFLLHLTLPLYPMPLPDTPISTTTLTPTPLSPHSTCSRQYKRSIFAYLTLSSTYPFLYPSDAYLFFSPL